MSNYLYVGAVPCQEECAQVGSENYQEIARKECLRYIAALRRFYGMEPAGCKFQIKSCPHDFGSYLEVVIIYAEGNEACMNYAFEVEAGLQYWHDAPEPKED